MKHSLIERLAILYARTGSAAARDAVAELHRVHLVLDEVGRRGDQLARLVEDHAPGINDRTSDARQALANWWHRPGVD